MLPSYRNQSVDFLYKSTDWFLWDGNIGRSKVNYYIPVHLKSHTLNSRPYINRSRPAGIYLLKVNNRNTRTKV